MQEFFRGWKRKTGIVTLLITCMLTAGWVRSTRMYERFGYRTGESCFHWIYSVRGEIWWIRSQEHDGHLDFKWYASGPDTTFLLCLPSDRTWYWRIGKLEYGEYAETFLKHRYVMMPYWLLVIPLTLVSAWLFFSKLRPTKATQSESPSISN